MRGIPITLWELRERREREKRERREERREERARRERREKREERRTNQIGEKKFLRTETKCLVQLFYFKSKANHFGIDRAKKYDKISKFLFSLTNAEKRKDERFVKC